MGYTRYWTRTEKPITDEYIDFIQRLVIECRNQGIKLGNGVGEGNPVITENAIVFNGNAKKGLDHESFYISNDAEELGNFQFCKTARKPYDYAVRLALEEAEHQKLVTKVHSDGDNNSLISDEDYLNGNFGD